MPLVNKPVLGPAAAFLGLTALLLAAQTGADSRNDPQLLTLPNASGLSATFSANGPIDKSNPFFQKLGTNGRSCDTCHQPGEGWSVTPAGIRERFQASAGTDPIFRLNDGANSPLADVSTLEARRAAYSMLLAKGLIRVGIGIPADAEFELAEVDDPYGFASAAELSLFRRPMPSANLKFVNAVMWDGRETFADPTSDDCLLGTDRCFSKPATSLAIQANSATVGHAEAMVPLSPAQREAIVRFETGLFTAQVFDDRARFLNAQGAEGGPRALEAQPTWFGINDVLDGDYRTGAPFDPRAIRIYDAWSAASGSDPGTNQARRAVARGQAIFNTHPIRIAGVKGINDDLGIPLLQGTCTTCHDTPGAGNHSIPMPLDIGISDAARATPDMPLYVLRNKATGERLATTDPGRALITGRWRDIGRFKGPILRSLASRPPYFHNGMAADLGAVVDFYDERFAIGFTAREKEDLVAFLRAL